MSPQTRHTKSYCSTLSACAVAMAAVLLAGAPTWTNAAEPAKNDTKSMPSEKMDQSKMDGMKDMDGMSMTGDMDYDFAANMRMHHQKAVDMAQAELKNGKDPKMVRMAKDIIAAQKKEIAAFDKWMEAHKKPMTDAMPKSK